MKQALRKPRTWLLLTLLLVLIVFIPPCLRMALISYSEKGQTSAVGHLLAIGVFPTDEAVLAAAYNGHTDVVRRLLDAGASPNSQTESGETALAYASENGHTETVALMLAHGADPNWGCREMDPLTVAKFGKHMEIVQMLKKAGAQE